MTIKDAEVIIDQIEEIQAWETDFAKRLEDASMSLVNSHDKRMFRKMGEQLLIYKHSLWLKVQMAKDNTEI